MIERLICPSCHNKIMINCLASYPVKYEARCHCGFDLRYFQRKNSHEHITQIELNESFNKGVNNE